MGTLVSPMRGATVAMPAASRCRARIALAVLFARLSIAKDDVEIVVSRTRMKTQWNFPDRLIYERFAREAGKPVANQGAWFMPNFLLWEVTFHVSRQPTRFRPAFATVSIART